MLQRSVSSEEGNLDADARGRSHVPPRRALGRCDRTPRDAWGLGSWERQGGPCPGACGGCAAPPHLDLGRLAPAP